MNRNHLRRFRNISRRFLDGERSRHLLIELAIFSLLAALSAWPVANMIDAIGSSLK